MWCMHVHLHAMKRRGTCKGTSTRTLQGVFVCSFSYRHELSTVNTGDAVWHPLTSTAPKSGQKVKRDTQITSSSSESSTKSASSFNIVMNEWGSAHTHTQVSVHIYMYMKKTQMFWLTTGGSIETTKVTHLLVSPEVAFFSSPFSLTLFIFLSASFYFYFYFSFSFFFFILPLSTHSSICQHVNWQSVLADLSEIRSELVSGDIACRGRQVCGDRCILFYIGFLSRPCISRQPNAIREREREREEKKKKEPAERRGEETTTRRREKRRREREKKTREPETGTRKELEQSLGVNAFVAVWMWMWM